MPRRPPLVVAYGLGVDSTAMLIGLAQRGIRPDLILFADVGGEKPDTYLYAPIIRQWLRDVDFPLRDDGMLDVSDAVFLLAYLFRVAMRKAPTGDMLGAR